MARVSNRRLAAVFTLFVATSCSRHDQQLQDHYDTLSSVAASVTRVADAWLSGETSGTFTATALDQMFQSSEQERAALSATTALVADPRGAAMADSASDLSRRIALMIGAVRGADGDAVRRLLRALPFTTAS